MGWTEERIELLKKRWADGLSASQIAAELGGVTRNAVIGKVHRLGLSGRAKSAPSAVSRMRATPAASAPRRPAPAVSAPQRTHYATQGSAALAMSHAPAPAPRAMAAPRIVPIEVVDIEPVVCERVTIMELKENMCRWPLGDPSQPEFRFCGGRSTPGAAYCTHHSQIAYQPANDRRNRRIPAPIH